MEKCDFRALNIAEFLKTKRLGKKVTVFDSLPSTNTYLKELPQKTDGEVIIALSQTGGRGRRSKSFFSPVGGLYLSVLVNADSIGNINLLTTLCAVATAKAIESIAPLKAGIKWVNDIYVNSKKVCGILCEGILGENGKLESIVIGIGVNVKKTKFPEDIKNIASALENECDFHISTDKLAAEIINHLEEEINNISSLQFIKEAKQRSVVLGKEIEIVKPDGNIKALALDLDNDGHLIAEIDGKKEVLSSGEISIKLK